MPATSFEPSQELSDVRFGLMGHFTLSESNYIRWQRNSGAWIKWYRSGATGPVERRADDSAAIGAFRTAEDFLVGKMLFVDKEQQKKGLPDRGELNESVPAQLRFFPNQAENVLDSGWKVILSYYSKYECLMALLYTRISKISVDQLILLRELKWYQKEQDSWILSYNGKLLQTKPLLDLIHRILRDVCCCPLALESQQKSPLFSLIELRQTGPAWGFMNGCSYVRRLKPEEHFGLLSGDEGYRLADAPDFDQTMQFTGRNYFSYQFSPTNCIAFYMPDMGEKKTNWADWYRGNVARVPTLDRYIRLDPFVPCLADGIPLLIELCLIRYVELTNLKDEIGKALSRKRFWTILLRLWTILLHLFGGNTRLEKAQSKLEQLDLYQDSALWIVGGSYTDKLFAYSAIRERVDRMRKSYQQVQSEIISTILTIVAILISVLALWVAILTFRNEQDHRASAAVPPPQHTVCQRADVAMELYRHAKARPLRHRASTSVAQENKRAGVSKAQHVTSY